MRLYPREGAALDASFIRFGCPNFEWQVASVVQLLNCIVGSRISYFQVWEGRYIIGIIEQ